MRINNSIEKYINEKGLCTGCGICTSLFENCEIKMEMRSSGFYRPVFSRNLSKVECEQLAFICPALNMNYEECSDEDIPLWGNAVECRIGWSAYEDIRYQASSGGGVTSFLLFLLEQKKVDGIIHVGRKNNQFVAEGVLSTTTDEIKANIGSLYMPVSMLSNLKELLDKVEKVAIVGKGCDIRAVRRFVELNPEYKSKIIVCIGILCGGAPSILGTYEILNEFGMKKEEVNLFRYRGFGWPGYCTAISSGGDIKKMTYNDAWAKQLGPTSPLVCKVCFDGIADAADIVFGDAWKCENGNYPSFEETEGRNLIICRNGVGRALLDESALNGYMVIAKDKVDNGLFRIMQPSQSNRRYLAKLKIVGLRILGFVYPCVNMKYLSQIEKSAGVKLTITQKARTICGSIKRARRAKEVK